MSIAYHRLARAPNYVRSFGLLKGIALLWRVEGALDGKSTTKRKYQIPGFRAPLWLRDTVSDHATFWQNIVKRHYDLSQFPQTARLMESYRGQINAGKRPVIIDGGANIGLSAIWFALHFPHGQILAIEPEEENYTLLSENVAAYGDAVRPIHGGLWPRSESLVISNLESGAAAFRTESAPKSLGRSIRGYTVDELLRIADNSEALIVKLDIEGSQKALFSENTDWIGRTHLIILELDDWQFPWTGTSRPFFQHVAQYPFDYILSGEHICCFRDFSS